MKKGFSLVEIIIILFIISIGLLGVLSLIIQNIQSQGYNKNNLVAYQLAQEGVELIRMVRDSNWRQGEAYDAGLNDGIFFMDYQDSLPHLSSGVTGEFILHQGLDGFYYHGGTATSSGFSRQITLKRENANTLKVTVNVGWQERGRDSYYDLQTILYNWK